VNALEQEKALCIAKKIAKALVEMDLVIMDELGYLPFSTSSGALLFHLLNQALGAHKRGHHHKSELQRMGNGLW
jgi:DNA replication protein DnaC